MDIAGLRVRIMIQKHETNIDEYQNHKSTWVDYFGCWATASSTRIADESHEAAHTETPNKLDFTVRWCQETVVINPKEYRIQLDDKIYDIVDIDPMNFRHNSVKFRCKQAER